MEQASNNHFPKNSTACPNGSEERGEKKASPAGRGREGAKRLVSLDLLRGLTVAMMILVNNGYGESFSQLRHKEWNGMTVCDLVFPFFLFMVGISTYLSLRKTQFQATTAVLQKIFKRAVLLFLIGLGINWFDHAIGGDVLCFGHLRIWAVMQRIALCYLAASLFAVYANHKYTIPTIVALLAVYTLIITLGNGYAYDAEANILAQADLRLFGYDHLYHKSPVDPEGLLSTIPAIAHTLIGFLCGKLVCSKVSPKEKVRNIFIFGALLTIAGFALSLWLPLNKRIWSPSYVLATCGLAMLLLSLIIKIEQTTPLIQRDGQGGGSAVVVAFLVFGMNPLFLYVLSELMAIVFGHFGISEWLFNSIHSVVSAPKWASLCYALTFVFINWLVGYILYRKKIFIKI
ncbi:MAG: DUF1624 domain-containing protein [Prevotella sp.]|nr:DUF1624 domain-containing protein [Prevotella sp.]